MTPTTISSFVLRSTLVLLLAATGLFATTARAAEPPQSMEMTPATMAEKCQEMKGQKQQMKEDMQAEDARMTAEVAAMNKASRHKKVDLMAALITHGVDSRIAMDARKAKMEEEMMKHMMMHMEMGKESMSPCPMIKDLKATP